MACFSASPHAFSPSWGTMPCTARWYPASHPSFGGVFALLAMLAVVCAPPGGNCFRWCFLPGWAPCCSLWRPTTGWACSAGLQAVRAQQAELRPGRARGFGLPGRPPPRAEHGPPGLIFLAVAFLVTCARGWSCPSSAVARSPGSSSVPAILSLRPPRGPRVGFAGRHQVRLRLHDALGPAAGGLCLCAHSAIRAGTLRGVSMNSQMMETTCGRPRRRSSAWPATMP